MRWLPFRRISAFRRILVAAAVVVSFAGAWLVAGQAPAAAVGGDPAAQEHELLRLINAERARNGAGAVGMQADLVAAARIHAASMRDQGGLYHDLEGKQATAPLGWNRLGENVGVGGAITGLHAAFMASPSHAVNVLQREFNWAGIGIVHDANGRIWVSVVFMGHPSLRSSAAQAPGSPTPPPAPAPPAPRPVAPVGVATVPGGKGYWRVTANGGVFAHDGAPFHGSAAGIRLRRPIVGIAPTPTGKGYWLVAADGGIFSFGDARFHGSLGGSRVGSPIQRMVAGPTGAGYWLIAADGQLFPFGEAGPRPRL